ncbi:c6 finger domain-containing protein [Colletotrichum scovillei]|uniref:C6 finger domain-containing protein n=1 Tax=Colletotrichum scovillei TaxID=1209932 RepID=A0A9P7UL08_9PEZI|nr:c6 finger domain-containing protein [Colletotrichum scovillei]KAG7074157.1 c6 finger domain-containing protein [Colletotrichum scovillei]KAG7081369.1 c6 finger domain-containing protein [Colletotrichum scovillei]
MTLAASRKKSCVLCRTSKARCSLGTPCRRCEERDLRCRYDHVPKQSAGYRSLRPAETITDRGVHGALNQLPNGTESLIRIERDGRLSGDHPRPDREPSMDWSNLLSTEIATIPLDSESISQRQLLSPNPFSLSFDSPQLRQTVLGGTGVPWVHSNSNLFGPEDLGDLGVMGDTEYQDHEHSSSEIQLHRAFRDCPARKIRPFYQDKPLVPRITKTVATCFTARVLLGQILSYPKMMIKGGRMPPFIFPPCAIDGSESIAGCCGKELHQCLPEPLAICCNLVQSFYQRTPGSAAFVWRSIYSEVGRIRQEHSSYNSEQMLHALQAVVIYLLLQANDLQSIQESNIKSLLVVPNLLARSLHLSLDYEVDLTKKLTLDRRGWVLPMGCRTICLLFGIELLVDVDLNAEEPSECGGYSLLPLPSGRDLWETVSCDEWRARYRRLRAESCDEKVLSIQDLRKARRALGADSEDRGQEDQLVAQVAKWCEGLDEFGMMVWMAVMLE